MYDIFFVGSVGWNDFKILYPNAQQVSSGVSYDDLSKKSFTKVFWVVWDDLKILDFSLNSYRVTEWDNRYIHVFKNGKSYDGICLFPKNLDVTETEFQTRYFRNKKEVDIEASLPVMYDKFQIADFEDYQYAIKNTKTTMFWGIWPEIDIEDESIFELYFSHHDSYNRNENHVFKNLRNNQETFLNGLVLYSKNKPISEREIKHRYLINKKEHDRIVSINRYPTYLINEYEEYLSAIKSCCAEMFWIQWPEIEITDTSIFDLYFDPRNGIYDTDRTQNHIWPVKRNDETVHIEGLWLCSTHQTISKREFSHRYLINKKEHADCAGTLRYPIYTISNYDDYQKILQETKTEMFWVQWPEIEITDESVFDLYFDPRNGMYDEDRTQNHVWPVKRNNELVHIDGLWLCSVKQTISKREFTNRYLINKKEHDECVGKLRYPICTIRKYDDYKKMLDQCRSEMFWAIWPEIEITDESVFDLYFDPRNGMYDSDRQQNHVFKNLRNSEETYSDGLVLFSKHTEVSEREIKHRYLINKKEHNCVVSVNRYPKHVVKNYEEYQSIVKRTKAEMFWAIWPEIEITDESVFDLYFDPRNGMYDEDRAENHAWQHQFRMDEITYGGLHLMCKNKPVSKKEIDFRFLINKKEHEETASQHRMYDIVFISYNEPNADENYEALQQRFPHAKRVHGVKGIHQAHIAAAKLCDTEMFWVVDGDAAVNNDFDFSHVVNRYEISTVHVWRSLNPVNGLIYGYGGIKLLPTTLTINMDTTKPDMTTSISERFKAVQEVSNTTAFNTDPFNTWKGAFRECAKLASKVIDRQKDDETNERLKIWTTVGQDRPYGKYAIRGAKAGMKFGLSEKPNLKLINDFDWLQQQFVKHYDG